MQDSVGDEIVGEEAARDAFEEIDFGREFQDYLTLVIKTQEDRVQGRRAHLRTVSNEGSLTFGPSG